MMSRREWNDTPEVFDSVYQALEDAGLEVYGTEDEGSYGEQGYIELRDEEGRRFRLALHEITY